MPIICALVVMRLMIKCIGKPIVTNTQIRIPPVIVFQQDKDRINPSRLQFGKTIHLGPIIKKFTIGI